MGQETGKPRSEEPCRSLKTLPLEKRQSKVQARDFATAFEPQEGFQGFLRSLPDILAGKEFKELIRLFHEAKRKQRAIVFALGAHVIKVGLNPVLIRLLRDGWISGLALNGAGVIHDFEIAFSGQTSEDVEEHLADGSFGTTRETGEYINKAIGEGSAQGLGLGESVARMISDSDFPFKKFSLLAAARESGIPVTVHVAIGTDTIHFFPEASGEAIGKTSLADFFRFCSVLKGLDGGGLFINVGSAVILPEVFLKAVSFVRNSGTRLENFSTAVFDFIHHYRPYENVVRRPVKQSGKGFYFIGHHEIMIPLLAAALAL